jgi:hypothetical protein
MGVGLDLLKGRGHSLFVPGKALISQPRFSWERLFTSKSPKRNPALGLSCSIRVTIEFKEKALNPCHHT